MDTTAHETTTTTETAINEDGNLETTETTREETTHETADAEWRANTSNRLENLATGLETHDHPALMERASQAEGRLMSLEARISKLEDSQANSLASAALEAAAAAESQESADDAARKLAEEKPPEEKPEEKPKAPKKRSLFF